MEKKVVVGIGEILWDMLPDGKQLGGGIANLCYHCSSHGMESCLVSAVGDDDLGKEIYASMVLKQMSSNYIQTLSDVATSTVSVTLRDGFPSYVIHEPVAWDFISFVDSLNDLAERADAVCFGTLAQRNDVSKNTIRQFVSLVRPDCLRVYDINLRQTYFDRQTIEYSLNMADLLKISDEELPVIAPMFDLDGDIEQALNVLCKRFDLKLVVYTKGADGSVLCSEKGCQSFPVISSGPVVDTVGCGDSFTATLTCGLLAGLSEEQSMIAASRVAGYVCSCQGGTPSLPEDLRVTSLL